MGKPGTSARGGPQRLGRISEGALDGQEQQGLGSDGEGGGGWGFPVNEHQAAGLGAL